MEKENPKDILPKDFWQKERKTISMEESLKDVEPIDWEAQLEYEEEMGYESDFNTQEHVNKIINEKN